MDSDTRDLIRTLFARATAIAEDAAEAGVAGQRPKLEHEEAVALAQQLRVSAAALESLASAVMTLVDE